ncbi:MAG: phage tail protein [Clostridia bacterium]|nr:phage tail protein [Clostridia bacterium]
MEELNGAYTADIELTPFPGMGQVLADMIIRLPAPVRETPYLEIAGTEETPGEIEKVIWKINVTTSTERSFTYIYSKPAWDYEYALKRLYNGTEYEFLGKTSSRFHRAIAPDGTTGYILNGDGEFSRNIESGGTPGTEGYVVESKQTRDQLFRIRRVVPSTNGITIFARHISYDLKDNYVAAVTAENATGAALATAIVDNAAIAHPYNLFSDVDAVYTGSVGDSDPMTALIDADTGLTAVIGGEVLRDNFDIYYAKAIGRDRGASIEYGKNAQQLEILQDEDGVCTRLIPIGYDQDNNQLMLPELYVDSPRAGSWNRPRGIQKLDLRECKIGDTYANAEAVYIALREKALAYFEETAIDRPSVSANAEYVDLSRTSEARNGPVSYVYLGDTVTLRDYRYGYDLKAKVTAYVFDCLNRLYRSISLGTPYVSLSNIRWAAKNLANGSISAVKLMAQAVTGPVISPQAVTGGKIADGTILARNIAANTITGDQIAANTIVAGNLAAGAVTAEKLDAEAVTAEKIKAGAVSTDKLDAGAVTAEKLASGAVSADMIVSGKLSTDRLIIGGTEFSIVRALNQLANSLSQNDDTIDGDVLSDKSISAVKVTDDFGAGLELSSNAAVLLLAGKLDGTNSHMELTQDAINMVGGEINIATNDLQIRGLDDGGEIMSLDPEGLSAKRVVVTEAFSAPNVVMSHPVATAEWKGGIQKSLDALPKYLTQDTTLTVPAGTYVEDVAIKGFVGAGLTLQLSSGVNINGRVSISDCSRIGVEASTLGDAAIYPRSGGAYTIDINSCQYVLLDKLYISGYRGRASTSDGTDRGVQVFRSNVRMQNCCIEYTDNYAYYQELGTFFIHTVIGGSEGSDATTNANLGYSVRALNGAHGGMYLAVPLSVSGYSSSAATLLPVSVTPTAGGMEYVEPEYITQTFTLSKHCTYLYGVKRIRDDQATTFSQGYYGTYASGNNNWRIGAMWFADAASALSGKTIKSAKLTMRRASGGWSNAVPVYLGTVALAESDFTSTLTPTFNKAATYPVGNLARETEATYDVTALMSAIQAGQAIGVFEPRSEFSGNFSPAYTNFYGLGSGYEPVLTVEYK